jgi:hypothetical protein
VETAGEGLAVVALEAFHIFAVCHHLNSLHDLTLVVSDKFEGEEEEVFEVEEDIGVCALH